jgi:Transglutaminase-like superfamily
MESVGRWIGHSRMTDPAHHAAIVADLPPTVGALNNIIQGVLIHSDWLSAYGVDEARLGPVSRTTLPVAERLEQIFKSDIRALDVKRSPARRSVGTCRDFALLLCSFLRGNGVPSRVRCGFADYLGDGWEDHWVCEYWDPRTQGWRRSDPQIDEVLKARLRITFDPTDIPRRSFMTAGQVWMDCRAGKSDPDRFGHGETTGLWFVKVNVFRDHYVLNNRETSTWDTWRAAPETSRVVDDYDASLLDNIATCPEQPLIEISPGWLA